MAEKNISPFNTGMKKISQHHLSECHHNHNSQQAYQQPSGDFFKPAVDKFQNAHLLPFVRNSASAFSTRPSKSAEYSFPVSAARAFLPISPYVFTSLASGVVNIIPFFFRISMDFALSFRLCSVSLRM